MSSDNQFTALGPAVVGFQTDGANIDRGAEIAGKSVGILGHCDSGNGVHGESTSATDSGVYGHNTGGGTGVGGLTNGGTGNSKGIVAGVWGLNQGVGAGVRGSAGVADLKFATIATPTGVLGEAPKGVGVYGDSRDPISLAGQYEGDGVLGDGGNGVHGRSSNSDGSGVWGENRNLNDPPRAGYGVVGSSKGIGVFGALPGSRGFQGKPNGVVGVWGSAVDPSSGAGIGDGVLGEGVNGVHGRSTGVGGAGVRGTGGNQGVGVLGEGHLGVRGVSNGGPFGLGSGVVAEHTAGGTGLFATSTGTGVVAEGSIAPLQLVPSQTPGHPTSGQHSMGELYVDVQGVLYFCIASGPSGGTWKRVQLI